MDWNKLLSSKTQIKREDNPTEFSIYPISDIERDYEQIISSSAFRRLQDKTQVFPLDKSDFVRTRLTHSIEVSSIARQLGIMITKNTSGYGKEDFKNGEEDIEDIPSILACAGLLHDIGNPPFGHFGEVIIGDWFKKEFEKEKFSFHNKLIKEIINPQMKRDLENFEGNAQALRILTKSHKNGNDLNLSYSIINTLIKYPTNSIEFSNDNNDIFKHKMGYYYSEKEILNDICEETGTKIENNYVRHPLTYLLEAADDIAYSTADLEDALKKGLFTLNQFILYFKEEIDKIDNTNKKYQKRYTKALLDDLECIRKNTEKNIENDFNSFSKWIGDTKKWLMYVVAYRFSNSYKNIMKGAFKNDLFWETNHEITIKVLKNAMKRFVFNDVDILKLELSAKKIIETFLKDFIYAIRYWEEEDANEYMSKADKKYISIIPQDLRDDYIKSKPKDQGERLYKKFLLVTDFISGMTDSYAKNLYQELYVIK